MPALGYDLVLPYPPAANTYYRSVGHRVLLSDKGRQYKQRVWMAVRKAIPGIQKLTGRLAVSVYATMPDHRRRDLDGIPKGLLDALNGLAWVDDEQIDQLGITRVGTQKPGKVFVRIETVDENPTNNTVNTARNGQEREYEPLTLGVTEAGE